MHYAHPAHSTVLKHNAAFDTASHSGVTGAFAALGRQSTSQWNSVDCAHMLEITLLYLPAYAHEVCRKPHCLCPPAGMDVVFHCATAAPQVQNASTRAIMHAVNVLGTQNVIAGCVQHGVPKLVYTSSASVVFAGKDLLDIDETAPYPVKPLDYYTQSKVGANACPELSWLAHTWGSGFELADGEHVMHGL